jgi:hypothetical protein
MIGTAGRCERLLQQHVRRIYKGLENRRRMAEIAMQWPNVIMHRAQGEAGEALRNYHAAAIMIACWMGATILLEFKDDNNAAVTGQLKCGTGSGFVFS